MACCLLFFPSGGLGRTHFSPACCRTLVVVDYFFSRPAPPDLGGGVGLRADEDIGPYELGPLCVARDDSARRFAGGLSFVGGLLGRFRLRARYFCRQTKVPKSWLRNLRFLRTSLGGGLLPAFLPIRRSWSNTFFSRVLSHLGGGRLLFLPTGTAGPGWWGGAAGR